MSSVWLTHPGRADRENDPLAETTTAEEVIFDGRFMKLVRDSVRLPDGGESQRLFVCHSGAAAVVAVDASGAVYLERQWRHPLGRSFWELPAGKLDPNEPSLECAKRELHEECGLSAAVWTRLGTLHTAIGYSNEAIEIFLAEGICEGEQMLDPGETLEVCRVPWEEALAMASDGRITDSKTIAGLFWAQAHFARRRNAD